MEKTLAKVDSMIENYVSSLQEQPIKTIIKTLVIIWIITKIKKLL